MIFQLLSGYTLPKSMLVNAVHNNPHGYGIIIKREGKLTVIKDLPVDGNDPEVIYKILKDNEDAERFCHVRWKTQGTISRENTQPFQVYNDRGREIWFAHNGTLSSYTPSYQHGQPGEISDSRKFAETVLMKYLPKFMGENGVGDYQDEVMIELLEKAWSHGNKGILVSNDLDPYFLGLRQWETINTSENDLKGNFFASNNDYFMELKRGPLFEKLQEAKREKEAEERAKRQAAVSAFNSSPNDNERAIVPISCPAFTERFSLGEDAVNMLEDYDMYSPDGYIQLSNLTYAEWITILKKTGHDDVASMFLYLTDFLKKNTEALIDLQGKHSEQSLENDALKK